MNRAQRPYIVEPYARDGFPRVPEYLRCERCQLLMCRWVRRTGCTWRCDQCGYELIPQDRPRRPPTPDAARDLGNLAEWSPYLEGHGVDHTAHLANVLRLEPGEYVDRERRIAEAIQEPTGDDRTHFYAPGDKFPALAEAMHAKATQHGQAPNGRPDSVDARSPELAAAVATLRRLDALTETPEGARHAIVLLYAFWHHGPASRAFWDAATDAEIVDRARYARRSEHYQDAHPYERKGDGEPLGFGWRVGIVFVETMLRAAWLHHGALGRAFARQYGEGLLSAAQEAWRAELPACRSPGRVSLARAREALSGLQLAADWEIDEVYKPLVDGRRKAAAQQAKKSA